MEKISATKNATASSGIGGGATLLIVEDSPVQAELLRRALEGAGYKVLAAGDGAQGLAMAKAHRPAAVVSDINMPLMDGYALCHAIRSDEELKRTPVILLTMLSDAQDVIRGLGAGADAYLTKPYNIPTLVARVESLLAYPPDPPPPVERRKVEVRLDGVTHVVDAHGPRMLNLLISTYENAVLQNRELAITRKALEELNAHLEQEVAEKTAEIVHRERRYHSLVERASDLVTVVDANGAIAYISPSVRRLGGYEPTELLGTQYLDYAHPEDRQGVSAAIDAMVRESSAPQTSEFRFRHKDGSSVVLESIAHNALDDPAINGIVINSRDVTERHRDEQRSAALLQLAMSAEVIEEKALLQRGIDTMQQLTDSRIGFLHFVSEDQNEIELAVWTADTLAHYCEAAFERHYPLAEAGIWADCVRLKEAVVINDYAAAPGRKGLPQGHSALQRFISVPVSEGERVRMIVGVGNAARDYGKRDVETLQLFAYDLFRMLERKRAQDLVKLQVTQLKSAVMSAVGVATTLSELRDPYTAGHERRVGELAAAIGAEFGFDAERQEGLRVAGYLHDVGKVMIPTDMLSKPGKLNALEYQMIREHAQASYDVLKGVDFAWPVAQVALQHHERIDGSGYPQGLKGEAIMIEARIMAVADVIEAMSSHRPYREAQGIDAALAEIEHGRGSAYDPAVADACVKLFREKGYTIPS